MLNRALASGDVIIPNMCDPAKDYGRTRFTGGDVIVTSGDGGETFEVGGKTYTSRGGVSGRVV